MGGGKGGKGGGGDVFPSNFGEAQALINLQNQQLDRALNRTSQFNFFDRVSPFGTTTFQGTPGSADFRQIETLDPMEQQALDNSRRQRLAFQSLAQNQLGNLGGMFDTPVLGGEDLIAGAAPLEQATFQRGLNLLQPVMDEQSARLESSLVARGLPRSSEAFELESDRLARQQANALENLALSSVGAGRQEQSRLLEADLARRAGTLGELGSLGFGGQASFPSIQAPQLGRQSADVMGPFGLMSQGQLAQNQMAQDKKASEMGALGTIGSAALMAGMFASHSTFKENREPAPDVLNKVCDLNIETWNYKPEHSDSRPHIGPMAEEFNETFGLGPSQFIFAADGLGVALKAIQELREENKALARAMYDLAAHIEVMQEGAAYNGS